MAISWALVVCVPGLSVTTSAQEMQHDHTAGSAPKVDAGVLTIAFGERSARVLPEVLKAMAHKTITVRNGHTDSDESYSGVLLSDLLTQVGAPLGAKLHGKAVATYLLAAGSDGYQALYSIAEIDPAFHSGDVIVADSLNGKPLATDGPFKLVNTEDKHPARWVRNLVSVRLITP